MAAAAADPKDANSVHYIYVCQKGASDAPAAPASPSAVVQEEATGPVGLAEGDVEDGDVTGKEEEAEDGVEAQEPAAGEEGEEEEQEGGAQEEGGEEM